MAVPSNHQHPHPSHRPFFTTQMRPLSLFFVVIGLLIIGVCYATHGNYRFASDGFRLASAERKDSASTEGFKDVVGEEDEFSLSSEERQTSSSKPTARTEHDVSGLKPPNRIGDSKRILVTGGAGFIGSHLVDRLMDEGHSVMVLDNLFTGRKSNLKRHFTNPRFEFIRHDVTEPISLEVDQVYHLACPASPVHYKYNPVKTIKTSFMGTYNMLGLAKRTSARFLLTSTSEVYGDPLVHPQHEEYWGNVNPIGERACYDEGKRVAETLTTDFHRQDGVEVRIARIFNTYGPRMALNDGRVVSNFVGQALRGEKLTVQGNGNQTRSFCYVSDMVDGLIRLMNTDEVDGPVNVGNPGEFTIKELAHVVKEVVSPGTDLSFVPNTPDDPRQRKPDITKAKSVLRWEPKVELRDGLKLMADDFKKRVNKEIENW
eukprot:Plantae.Rhodophyta-Hildenbrandia_rubra.ctg28133.p1 GENE.Plantae.Rhodophyta-Hildenbrandia_rubra.ctg28133~~Plantae.Rhodophyta-Hildenbrandia_rubra.ctg28133.p1  ORF type:complete len:430 (+),score=73.29 Plantae.Rhodophyta-Hildenbrandia_rubra.ctg28133:122-1411(+)